MLICLPRTHSDVRKSSDATIDVSTPNLAYAAISSKLSSSPTRRPTERVPFARHSTTDSLPEGRLSSLPPGQNSGRATMMLPRVCLLLLHARYLCSCVVSLASLLGCMLGSVHAGWNAVLV